MRTVGTSASIIFPCSIKIQKTGGGETQPECSTALYKAEGRVFLLVPAYPGCPRTKAVKWLLVVVVLVDELSLVTNCHLYSFSALPFQAEA